MRIAVVGMWHLGTVMSALLADAGHDVVALDEADVVEDLRRGRFPVAEPGLPELASSAVDAGRLVFASDLASIGDREIVLFAFDTPVREDGTADVERVVERIATVVLSMQRDALAIVSSQLPVGSISELERRAVEAGREDIRFACMPENLRLGKSIDYVRNIDRFVVGVRREDDSRVVRELLRPITDRLLVVSVESAEMTKHALNAFLATSVAFINEIASLCELTGADAREVERGLKSDMRIGDRAYVRPGGPFAGGTLARDIGFLIESERAHGLEPRFFEGVRSANDYHGGWLQRRFLDVVGDRRGKTIALLGLVYKPGTDTLRSSTALAFARWMKEGGGSARGFDPAISAERSELHGVVDTMGSPVEALRGADAAFVATEWPEFRAIPAQTFLDEMKTPIVFDPGRFLDDRTQRDVRLHYVAIGDGIDRACAQR